MNAKKTVLSLAIGSAFAVSFAAAPSASATEAAFGMSALKSGYMLADASDKKMPEGKCGDMKTTKAKDAKCGSTMKSDKTKAKAKGKSASTKMPEGKCGEGKCGAKMADKAAPAATK